ncbi:uncharacterized protein LOC143067365 isoform X2 [Mytilus galloprovincialis]|uniref:uncharacterized protein LOC143067365 isoform X2 n=1 Tax=Mytilus galloprovincialis TaxID=29158 RepID=UPI003F7BD832
MRHVCIFLYLCLVKTAACKSVKEDITDSPNNDNGSIIKKLTKRIGCLSVGSSAPGNDNVDFIDFGNGKKNPDNPDVPTCNFPSNWWQYNYPYDVIQLIRSQSQLQENNLIDSYTENHNDTTRGCFDPKIGSFEVPIRNCSVYFHKERRLDGLCNDFKNVGTGSRNYRFGRNVPLNVTVQDDCNLYNPNPRDISRKLMQRKEFIPATSINILIAGWVQFMIHDWFGSGPNDKSRHFEVPVKDDDPDFTTAIKINRTRPDNCTRLPGVTTKICKNFPRDFEFCKDAKDYETHQNINTHWWDASQLYGVDATTNNRIRSKMDGKLQLTADNRLPIDSYNGLPVTGLAIDWWVGLGMFHIIWTREHNYVCDMLKQRNPTWDDDKLYHTARLIIGGVIAKIHTLEWTPAILQNKLVSLGLRSNWYGVSLMEFAKGNSTLAKILTDIIPTLANGIPGSVGKPKNMRDVPYSITQDFIAVYRLHPLMPDTFNIRNHLTGAIENSYQMQNVVFEKTEKVFQENSLENLFYSFGNDHPGAMTLHNYPNFLRNLTLPPTHPHGAGRIDLATIDILRDRERGVPRYNEFRRQLHLTPITSFEDLTTNTAHVKELRQVYNDDVEKIDLLIGSLAESPLPEGFGFSDTFFRIFLVMARRRLEADRFFTDYYTPEFYTQWGLDYIDRTYLKDILLRHYPTLSSQLQPNVTNVFIPWKSQTTLDKKFPYPDW